jgi:hypothetical protein
MTNILQGGDSTALTDADQECDGGVTMDACRNGHIIGILIDMDLHLMIFTAMKNKKAAEKLKEKLEKLGAKVEIR